MPTYSYRCRECGHEYNRIQKITDNSRAKCPECGARGERVITGGGGLIFKGSGFYITDYKRGAEKSKAGETSESGEKAGTGKQASAEKKAEETEAPDAKKGEPS